MTLNKKIIAILLMLLIVPSLAFGAVEDFTTYTEVDENGDITVTSTKLDIDTMRRDANSAVYDDKDAAHFGVFEHLFEVYMGTIGNNGHFGSWAVTNTAAATHADMGDGNDGIGCFLLDDTYIIYLRNYTDVDSDTFDGVTATLYYITVERTAAATNLYIYSDSGRTTLLDTLNVTFNAETYRYVNGCYSQDTSFSSTTTATGYVQNLDLQEADAEPPAAETRAQVTSGVIWF